MLFSRVRKPTQNFLDPHSILNSWARKRRVGRSSGVCQKNPQALTILFNYMLLKSSAVDNIL
jgi:hypothetical protein